MIKKDSYAARMKRAKLDYYNAQIQLYATKHNLSFNEAFDRLKQEKPHLIETLGRIWRS